MKLRVALVWLVVVFIGLSLACDRAGEVLSPEEATARAEEARLQPSGSGESAEGASFQSGDKALLIGTGFLINVLDEPGGRIVGGQARNSEVTVLESQEFEGEIWYRIQAGTAPGWVKADNLVPLEGEESGGEEGGEEAAASGPQVGDTVYLTGRGFLINIYDQPGGRLIANQERNVAVTILDTTEFEGTPWYLIDAPTGEGWVAAENITSEQP
ncbi:MAG: GW dipeptide domain-containing protein [Chloroflexi bacterium]|nr:GW dipeptide domain-containing protein [Chloroflexota bacterium]MCI0648787.1 GW dipeptide domain-containing protein [Chloroflexota bacterium]MCI0727255.1 GW dipeptide domain-containing protein [Chloroflexota bacterium]